MTPFRLRDPFPPDPTAELIAEAIARAGPIRVLRAAAMALLRPRPRPPDVASLPPRIREDLGLDPQTGGMAPPSARLTAGTAPYVAGSGGVFPGTGLGSGLGHGVGPGRHR